MDELEKGKVDAVLATMKNRWVYESGYILECIDLGMRIGCTMSLSNPDFEQDELRILLPPEDVESLGHWALNSMGQVSKLLPVRLLPFLESIVKLEAENKQARQKKTKQVPLLFKRGDLTMLRMAIATLAEYGRQNI